VADIEGPRHSQIGVFLSHRRLPWLSITRLVALFGTGVILCKGRHWMVMLAYGDMGAYGGRALARRSSFEGAGKETDQWTHVAKTVMPATTPPSTAMDIAPHLAAEHRDDSRSHMESSSRQPSSNAARSDPIQQGHRTHAGDRRNV